MIQASYQLSAAVNSDISKGKEEYGNAEWCCRYR